MCLESDISIMVLFSFRVFTEKYKWPNKKVLIQTYSYKLHISCSLNRLFKRQQWVVIIIILFIVHKSFLAVIFLNMQVRTRAWTEEEYLQKRNIYSNRYHSSRVFRNGWKHAKTVGLCNPKWWKTCRASIVWR